VTVEQQAFRKRGWISACIAPVACVLFLVGRRAGLWEVGGESWHTVLAGILVVEMLAGTVAPFWWLLTAFRRRGLDHRQPKLLICANVFALIVSLLFFF
jgi:hypothetical protein